MRRFGVTLLLALVPLALFVATEPPSASGGAYVAGALALAASLVVARSRARRVALAGLALIAAAVVVRLAHTKKAGDVRAIDRVIDERDISVNAARALAFTHAMSDPDVPALPAAMRAAYDEMDREEGALPSPFVATYLGLERPGASDTLEFSHDGEDAVVFLHGFAGNFTMSCWLFARAAARAGMTTVCPSTTAIGAWWTSDGETILRATIAALRARGKTRIFLAGLSNGAIGASLVAPRLSKEIAGLVLVSGASAAAGAPDVPTLVLQGRTDAQIPARLVRAYATRTRAEYVELDAGHFVLLVDRDRAERTITAWLSARRAAVAAAAPATLRSAHPASSPLRRGAPPPSSSKEAMSPARLS